MLLSLVAAMVLTGIEPSASGLAGRFMQVQESLPGAQPTYEGWSRRQLQTELNRLEDVRPGIGGPIAMLAIGAAVGSLDLVATLFGGLIALLGGGGFDTGVTIGLGITAVIAAGLIVLGAILIRSASRERARRTPGRPMK